MESATEHVEPISGTEPGSEEPSVINADPEAPYRYDESILIKVKGKVKQPVGPDEYEHKSQVARLQTEIQKYGDEIKEIKDAQEKSRASRIDGEQEIIRRKRVLDNEFQTHLREKQQLREKFQGINKEREHLRGLIRQLRSKLPRNASYDSQAFEAQIKELEYIQAHESDQDDKMLTKRIQELIHARPTLKEIAAAETKLKECDIARTDVLTKMDECSNLMDVCKAKGNAERKLLDDSREEQAAIVGPDANNKKKEFYEIIQALRAKIDELRTDYRTKRAEYVRLDKNYRAYMRCVRRDEALKRQEARRQREVDQMQAEEAANGPSAASISGPDAPPFYASELLVLDQLLLCLRKMLPADSEKASACPQESPKSLDVPEGLKPMKKKDDEMDMNFFNVSKKKGAKKGSADPAPLPKPAEAAKRKLHHPLETLQAFMQFDIEVPQLSTELQATITKVAAKKEELIVKGKEIREAQANGTYVAPSKQSKAVHTTTNENGVSGAAEGSKEKESAPELSVQESDGFEVVSSPVPMDSAVDISPAEEGVGLALQVNPDMLTVSVNLVASRA